MTADSTAATRAGLHAMLDALPDEDLLAAERLLSALGNADPALRSALRATPDDEPFTEEDRLAVEAARESYRRGDWVSGEDVRREIGW